MTLRTDFTDALKTAMLARDERATGTVRMIMAKLKDSDIAARSKGNVDGIGDAEIFTMLHGMIKQRRGSIALYQKGGRLDLVNQESAEIVVIERFLPKQMDENEMVAAITQIINSIDAKDIKDMGKVMGELKKNYAGKMDFAHAGSLVKGQLGGT